MPAGPLMPRFFIMHSNDDGPLFMPSNVSVIIT